MPRRLLFAILTVVVTSGCAVPAAEAAFDGGVAPDAGPAVDAGFAQGAGGSSDAGVMGDAGQDAGSCGDGTTQTCPNADPQCSSPLVAAPYEHCLSCFDAKTCDRQCTTDSDCKAGTTCQPDPNDPCNTTADCSRAGYLTCQPPPPAP